MNSFFNSQFSYCNLIWMFHSHFINNKINHLHERCLRLLYRDKSASSEKILKQGKSVTIHTRNLQILATDIFKAYRNISPPIFSEIFHQSDINYNSQINSEFVMTSIRSVFYGRESTLYLGPKLWDIVPLELTSVVAFTKGINLLTANIPFT